MTKRKAATDRERGDEPGKKQEIATADRPAFEDAMGELESIVRRLEGGGESLETALDDYGKAIGLLKVCHQRLEQAERRVEILSGFDADGNPVTEVVEETEESMEQKRHARSAKRSAKKGKAAVTKNSSSTSTNDSEKPGLF